jgi:hypothetical protein
MPTATTCSGGAPTITQAVRVWIVASSAMVTEAYSEKPACPVRGTRSNGEVLAPEAASRIGIGSPENR